MISLLRLTSLFLFTSEKTKDNVHGVSSFPTSGISRIILPSKYCLVLAGLCLPLLFRGFCLIDDFHPVLLSACLAGICKLSGISGFGLLEAVGSEGYSALIWLTEYLAITTAFDNLPPVMDNWVADFIGVVGESVSWSLVAFLILDSPQARVAQTLNSGWL